MAELSAPVLGLTRSEIQTYKDFQANASVRRQSSEKIVTASKNFELNTEFFENNYDKIKTLVDNMAQANAVMSKLTDDTGTCQMTRKVNGWFGKKEVTKEENLAKVNDEIQANLSQEQVVVALRTLGITPAPEEQPAVSNFTLPEAPSKDTLTKAGIGLGAAGLVGTGLYLGLKTGYDGYSALSLPSMPSMPSFEGVKNFFSNLMPDFSSYSPAAPAVDYSAGYEGSSMITPVTVGVGLVAAAALGGAAYVYANRSVEKNKQAVQVEQQQNEVQAS